MWSFLAGWLYATVVFPFAALALARAGGAHPTVVTFGVGPALLVRHGGGLEWRWAPFPGSSVAFRDDRAPDGVLLGGHAVLAVPVWAAAVALAPDRLRGALAVARGWASFQDPGVGGLLGALRWAWAHEPADPAGFVLATLAMLSAANGVLAVLTVVGRRLPPIAVGAGVLYLLWFGWSVVLDLRSLVG